jgi:hypothetical protein
MNVKLALLVTVLAACAAESNQSTATSALSCPVWGCGTNSATVGDGLLFDELDPSGVQPNIGGLYVVGARTVGGTAVRIRVDRDRMSAIALDGSRAFTGQELVGTIITLKHPINGMYEVLIAAVHDQTLQFWAGAHLFVPFYELMTRRLGEAKFVEYACKYDVLAADPAWTGVEHSALVFQGDHYDAEHKLVFDTTPSDPRFNIACAATAPAKMHLLRHTRAGSYDAYGVQTYATTAKERQAMLKMITADYCGTGHSFTRDGQRLSYTDSNGWYALGSCTAVESIWTADGAKCLDQPRFATAGEIKDECGYVLPSCGYVASSCGSITDWTSRGHVLSAIRPAP